MHGSCVKVLLLTQEEIQLLQQGSVGVVREPFDQQLPAAGRQYTQHHVVRVHKIKMRTIQILSIHDVSYASSTFVLNSLGIRSVALRAVEPHLPWRYHARSIHIVLLALDR